MARRSISQLFRQSAGYVLIFSFFRFLFHSRYESSISTADIFRQFARYDTLCVRISSQSQQNKSKLIISFDINSSINFLRFLLKSRHLGLSRSENHCLMLRWFAHQCGSSLERTSCLLFLKKIHLRTKADSFYNAPSNRISLLSQEISSDEQKMMYLIKEAFYCIFPFSSRKDISSDEQKLVYLIRNFFLVFYFLSVLFAIKFSADSVVKMSV